jgi:hypothetical protein
VRYEARLQLLELLLGIVNAWVSSLLTLAVKWGIKPKYFQIMVFPALGVLSKMIYSIFMSKDFIIYNEED